MKIGIVDDEELLVKGISYNLESEGYETDVIEFIDFEHSPKNLMLRARYTGKRRPGGRERAEKLRETYGFAQTLLDLTEKS